jgi:hypothetical protein
MLWRHVRTVDDALRGGGGGGGGDRTHLDHARAGFLPPPPLDGGSGSGGVGPGVVRSPIVPVPCGVGADRGGEAAALATATRARSFLFIFISPTARFRRSIADPPFRRRLTDEPDPDYLFFAAVARGHTRAGDTTADGAAREQPRARDVERGAQRRGRRRARRGVESRGRGRKRRLRGVVTTS